MALKFRITKTAFDKLSDEHKELYEADGDKHFTLAVEGMDDNGALKRAKDRIQEELDELKDEVKTKDKEIKTLKEAAGEGGADVTRLTRSHERKVTTLTEGFNTKLTGLQKFIEKTLIGGRAEAIASKISTVPKLMAKEIAARFSVEFPEDGEPVLKIKNKEGVVDPALTVDKLQAEFVANPDFKSILVVNKASGSDAQRGALPAKGATPANPPSPNGENGKVDVNALSDDDFVARVRQRVEAKAAAEGGTGASAE